MVRRKKKSASPETARRVAIVPELHDILAHAAIDHKDSIQGFLHGILCREFSRPDLMNSGETNASARS